MKGKYVALMLIVIVILTTIGIFVSLKLLVAKDMSSETYTLTTDSNQYIIILNSR